MATLAFEDARQITGGMNYPRDFNMAGFRSKQNEKASVNSHPQASRDLPMFKIGHGRSGNGLCLFPKVFHEAGCKGRIVFGDVCADLLQVSDCERGEGGCGHRLFFFVIAAYFDSRRSNTRHSFATIKRSQRG
jgi:hypothetical protein